MCGRRVTCEQVKDKVIERVQIAVFSVEPCLFDATAPSHRGKPSQSLYGTWCNLLNECSPHATIFVQFDLYENY